MIIKSIYRDDIYTSALPTIQESLVEAVSKRVNLCGANLYYANLRDANLSGANLSGAFLLGANLRGANLSDANLCGANLYSADLSGADLCGAYLSGAYLSGAYLSDANLCYTNLSGAFLIGANLCYANLLGADLSDANLCGANLSGANLCGKKVDQLRIFSGLYDYVVYSILFQDGTRMVRMGCLWKTLEEWEKIGIRRSNLSQFPDDGSDRCEERVAAFEFAKAAVLQMKPMLGESL
jgi:hypothetical protein